MTEDRHAKYGAATGILAVLAVLIGLVAVTPKPPDVDASALEFARYFRDHQDAIRWGLAIASAGVFFFIWFLGSVRSGLAAAEGGVGRLADVAFAGGVAGAAFFILGLTAQAAAAFRPDTLPPAETQSLADIFIVAGAPAFGAFMAFFAAAALVASRSAALPSWLTGTMAVAALVQPLGIGASVTQTGAFAGDGVLGFLLPVLGFAAGTIALSVALMRTPYPSAAAAAPPPADPVA